MYLFLMQHLIDVLFGCETTATQHLLLIHRVALQMAAFLFLNINTCFAGYICMQCYGFHGVTAYSVLYGEVIYPLDSLNVLLLHASAAW